MCNVLSSPAECALQQSSYTRINDMNLWRKEDDCYPHRKHAKEYSWNRIENIIILPRLICISCALYLYRSVDTIYCSWQITFALFVCAPLSHHLSTISVSIVFWNYSISDVMGNKNGIEGKHSRWAVSRRLWPYWCNKWGWHWRYMDESFGVHLSKSTIAFIHFGQKTCIYDSFARSR